MADGKIKYEVEVDPSGAITGLKKVESEAEKTAKDAAKKADETASKAKKAATSMATAFFAAEAAIAAFIGKTGLEFNAQLEAYQTSFEVMTGDAEYAYNIVERLKEQAASTPFDLTQLAKTTQLMMNYGIEGEKALDMMSRLGDIAQGDAQKLDSVSLAYSQMSSLGKVTLQDIKQMINGGFNPLQEISERTGESMASLYDRISDGTLAVSEIEEAMVRATSVGGKYFNSMQKQSETLRGRWNTLKDTVKEATGTMTAGLAETLADNILPKAIEGVKWLAENFEKLIPLVVALNAEFAVLLVVSNWDKIVGAVQEMVAAFTSMGGLVGIIAALYAAVAVAYVQSNQASDAFKEWEQTINDVNSATQNLHTQMAGLPDLMSGLGNNIETTAAQADIYISRLEELEAKESLTAQEQEEWNKTLEALTGIMPEIKGLIDDETGAIQGGTAALRDYVNAWKDKMYAQAMSDVVTEAIRLEMEATQNLSEARRNYEKLVSEQNGLYQQEAALIQAVSQALGVEYDSLEAAADAAQAMANEGGEDAQMLTDLANACIACNTKIDEHEKLLGEAEQAYKDAQVEQDKAKKTMEIYTEAQRKAASGTQSYEEAYSDAMDKVAAITTDTVDVIGDGTSRWEAMSAQWKLAAERNIDEGLVVALQRAGYDSQDMLAFMLRQSDDQLKQWNEVFRKDSTEAVKQISDAFKNSDAPSQSSVLARQVENKFNPSLEGAGRNAVAGAIKGMNSKAGDLAYTATTLANNVMRNFNVRLQIKSPSRVMEESGEYIDEGIESGMLKKLGLLKTAAVKLADTITGNFSPSVDVSGLSDIGSIQAIQQAEVVSQMAAQVNSAPINVHMNIDGNEFATATALPMSYALETLRLAEVRG